MRLIALLIAGLLATSAAAKDPEPINSPATPPDAGKEKAKEAEHSAAPSTPSKPSEASQGKAKATDKTDARTQSAKDKVTRSKNDTTSEKSAARPDAAYGRRVAAEIRRHIPTTPARAPGTVDVTFTIGASGRVVSHSVRRSSSPELTARVDRILASVKAPPPPDGSYYAHQAFNFH